MSLEAYIWANSLPLAACSHTPFRVLLRLADHADPLGYASWPAVETIADSLGCSTRTVQRALRDLVDRDLIRLGDQQLVSHFRADRRPVVYDLLTTALRAAEDRRDGVTTAVIPSAVDNSARGDNYRPHGVTTAVAHRNRPRTPYSDTQRYPQTARATTHVHAFGPSGWCIGCPIRDDDPSLLEIARTA